MAAPVIKASSNTAVPMSFAKTRHGYLIGVNGIERGIFWDGRSASADALGIDPPSTPPVMSTPQVQKYATATINVKTGTASNIAGEYILIKDGFGKTVKYVFRNNSDNTGTPIGVYKSTYTESDSDFPGGEVYVDLHGITASAASYATYLMTAIQGPYGHDGSISVTLSTSTLTLTQVQGGVSGNNTITDDIALAHIEPSGFAGGVDTGRKAYADITVADGDAASGMSENEYINIISTDGTVRKFVVVDDNATAVATGDVLTSSSDTGSGTAGTANAGGIAVAINLSGSLATQNDFLVQLKAAIEDSDGFGSGASAKVTVTAVPTEANGAQTVTLTQVTAGPEGNTVITTDISQITEADFTGGTNTSGATGGDYTCFYRYVDEREGARFYSNLSPFQVTTAAADDKFEWKHLSASSQTGRVTHIELLRTTFNQATTAYVVARLPHKGTIGNGAGSAIGASSSGVSTITVPQGHGLIAGARIAVLGSTVASHNATHVVTAILSTTSFTVSGEWSAYTGNDAHWTIEGYVEDGLTDGQIVLFRGDYRQKLLQTDGRPAANRHAIPPFFKSVCCAFQDRMTYLVDPAYSTGTISASNGSTTITGSGTAWSSDLEGRLICPSPGVASSTYIIDSVDSATQITTTKPTNSAIASSTAYTIINPPEERNTIYISEQDLPESVITQIAIQENVRDEDELVGAIVMGAQYYALKEHSIYRVTWAKNPLLDAQPQLAAMRGAINNRCADQHENTLYLMDEQGPYAFQGNAAQPIGSPISDFWKDSSDTVNGETLDFSKKDTWFVRVDPLEELAMFFVTVSGDSGSRPRTAFVYDIRGQTWTKWTYSWDVGDCVKLTYGNQRKLIMAATDAAFYVMNKGLTDGAANVSYSWKSGMFSWVESDQGTQRYFRVTFKPTTNTAVMNIKKYDNHSASPVAMNEWDGGDGVSIVQDATQAVADLKLSQHEDGDEPGSKVLPWTGKLPLLRGRPVRWVTCEIAGVQSLDRIIIYEIEIGGVK